MHWIHKTCTYTYITYISRYILYTYYIYMYSIYTHTHLQYIYMNYIYILHTCNTYENINIWNHLLCQLRAIAIAESHQPLNAPILSPPRHGGSGWNRRPRCTQSWPIYWDWTHSSNQRWELEFFDLIPEAASTILVLSIIYPSFIHLIHHLDLLKDLKATGSL